MPQHSRLPAIALVLALSGAAFSLHANYPGYLCADSFFQLNQILDGQINDWHPAFMTLVWSVLLKVLPGPVGILALLAVLVWGSLGLLAASASRRVGARALWILALPLAPGAFNYLGHVHKDALLAGWLLAAACSAWLADPQRPGRGPAVAQWAANLLMVAAFLTRPNVVFGLLPLLLYANRRMSLRRNLLLSTCVLVLMPAAMSVQNRALQVEARHGADSIKTYHLLALSYFEGRNLFPGTWTDAQSDQIVNACYSTVQWDTASPWGKCRFIHAELDQQGLWGSGTLTRSWLAAALGHPLQMYSAMAATYRKSMRDPNSRSMLYRPPVSDRINWVVAKQPLRATTSLAQNYARGWFNDTLGRPWVFAVASAAAVAVLFGAGLLGSAEGRLALALLASGMLYQCSYFATTVSAEYRYFYWSALATWLAVIFTLLAWRSRRIQAAAWVRPGLACRIAIALLTGLNLGLVAAPFKLPTEPQQVTLMALDEAPVTVNLLRTASTPPWMAVRFEGNVVAPTWQRKGRAFTANRSAGPLTTVITTMIQSLEIEYVGGPGQGRLQIDTDGHIQIIDAGASPPGNHRVILPAPAQYEGVQRYASAAAPAKVAAWALLIAAVLCWLGRTGRAPRARGGVLLPA